MEIEEDTSSTSSYDYSNNETWTDTSSTFSDDYSIKESWADSRYTQLSDDESESLDDPGELEQDTGRCMDIVPIVIMIISRSMGVGCGD